MKKYGLILVVCLMISSILLCACTVKPKKSAINYKRKLEKYLPSETPQSKTVNDHKTATIDLSEGPKLKYDAKMGPQDLNFDFKIQNPY